jgi:hypothetical protein
MKVNAFFIEELIYILLPPLKREKQSVNTGSMVIHFRRTRFAMTSLSPINLWSEEER